MFSFAYDLIESAGYEDQTTLILHVRVYRDTTANIVYADAKVDWSEDPDGSAISSYYVGPGTRNYGVFCAALKDTPSDGNHTYFVQVRAEGVALANGTTLNAGDPTGSGYLRTSNRSVVLLGVKR